jgi:4-carboxymuconolactone decarboxylase
VQSALELTMSRLPALSRDDLPPEAQAIWDAIAGPRGAVRGPYQILMHDPALAQRVEALGGYLRFHGVLPGAVRELTILAAARELDAPFEWVMHEPHAREAGTRAEAIEAVRTGGPIAGLTAQEQIVIEMVRSLYRTRSVPDDLYQRAVAELGVAHVVELVTVAGFYGMIAFLLFAFEMPLPDGVAVPFPHGDRTEAR